MFDFFRKSSALDFDVIEVELTTRCNAQCVYCPSVMFYHDWQEVDMGPELFQKLSPLVFNCRLIFFGGWGEPLLNNRFFEMAEMARKAHRPVAVSTNGLLIDDSTAYRIANTGIEMVSFALSGIGPSHEHLHKGLVQEDALSAISTLNNQRNEAQKPRIQVSYLLFRSALKYLSKLPELLKWRGIDKVIIRPLDYANGPGLAEETLLPQSMEEFEEVRRILEQVKQKGENAGLDIDYYLYRPGDRQKQCTEVPEKRLFVSASGDISPCLFTGLRPVDNSAGEEDYWQKLFFGNMDCVSPDQVWKSKPYRKFRESFRKGGPHPRCQACPKLYTQLK